MAARGQKDLALIMARELASNLSTPIFLVDAEGRLIFYNEAAEHLLGRAFAEVGELSADGIARAFKPQRLDGSRMPIEELPVTVAVVDRRPDHKTFTFTSLDGSRRTIAATAFPLMATAEHLVGAVAVFWEEKG